MDDSENGDESCLSKKDSILLINGSMLPYFPQVDTASEAFDVDTNNGINDGGTSSLLNEDAV